MFILFTFGITVFSLFIILNMKVAGSIPNEVSAFSNRPSTFSHTMALGLTQPLTERVPGILLGGQGTT
jgi:hypothetical protein